MSFYLFLNVLIERISSMEEQDFKNGGTSGRVVKKKNCFDTNMETPYSFGQHDAKCLSSKINPKMNHFDTKMGEIPLAPVYP